MFPFPYGGGISFMGRGVHMVRVVGGGPHLGCGAGVKGEGGALAGLGNPSVT